MISVSLPSSITNANLLKNNKFFIAFRLLISSNCAVILLIMNDDYLLSQGYQAREKNKNATTRVRTGDLSRVRRT